MEDNTIPQSTPTQIPNSSSKIPKDSHWVTILAMALFVLASLSVTAFLYYQNQFLKKMLASYQSQPSPTPSATANQTANWPKYIIATEPTLNLANYEIKLPPEWARIEHSSNFQNIETFQDPQKKYKLVIDQEKNFNNQTQKPYSNLKELTGLSYEVDKIDIDTQEAAKILPRAGSESTHGIIFFSRENKTFYKITLETPLDGSLLDKGKLIFDQILSTFKFLGASPSPEAKACTQEAKLCPDGSYVGREGPNCEFAPCPTP